MSILNALNRHYHRLAARGEVPPYGYSTEAISYTLVIADDGALVRWSDLREAKGKKLVGAPQSVPAPPKRTSGAMASFLWDNSKYVLGAGKEKGGKAIVDYPVLLKTFREWHERLLADTDDPGLLALLKFVQHWTPDQFTAREMPADILDQNLVFSWRGDEVRNRFIHDRPAARLIWENQVGDDENAAAAMCLVTGRAAAVARLHPAIKGVWGAQSSGASLVSFNLDASESYGKSQGGNAPVSKPAASNYGGALNALLKSDGANRTRSPIGDASTVFWAEVGDGVDETKARAAEELVGEAFSPALPAKEEGQKEETPAVTEAGQTTRLRESLNAIARGLAVEDVDPNLDPRTRFYMLGLSPNAARLSVRFWFETTLGELARRLSQHYRDLRLEPKAWKGETPAPGALLYPTTLQEKRENISPLLGGEVMRAIITGGRYPRALLAAVLQRIRAGDDINGPRAAICKAWLVRDARLSNKISTDKPEDYLVSLDRAEKDPAYRLGRLFSVLEHIQYRALGSVNASIRDRYFGAASATPASVFPLLLRGANHHLSVLRKKADTKGLAGWFEGEIGAIVDGLPMTLPRHLVLEDQGRFAVGYYHQRYAPKDDKAAATPDLNDSDNNAGTDAGQKD